MSGIVVVDGLSGGVTGAYGADVPSTPFDGSGGACAAAVPFADGVSALLCAGCVMSGGAF